ncbi:MAG: cyclase family protein [Gammaproteobacteria bacterium]
MLEVIWNGRRYRSHAPTASDLAIPLNFDGDGPRAFGAEAAHIAALASPAFSGRVETGASCNASVLSLAPHGNGTHTETVAHLCTSGPDVPSLLTGGWMPAWLASAEARGEMKAAPLHDALVAACDCGCTAFILRTQPNTVDKLSRRYTRNAPPPWLAAETASAIAAAGIDHLLVDLPSLDRLDDAALPAHRAFFGLPAASREARAAKRPHATVTEFIYAADELTDGLYLLDLQVPRWRLEAVPSRPLVLPAEFPTEET